MRSMSRRAHRFPGQAMGRFFGAGLGPSVASTNDAGSVAKPATARAHVATGTTGSADGSNPGSGPSVVAVGGGHGQAATLRAARRYAGSLTAVVAMADDGGSSGRLRRDLGIVPPGDLRACLVALAAESSTLARAFEHRYDEVLGDAALGAGGAAVVGGGGSSGPSGGDRSGSAGAGGADGAGGAGAGAGGGGGGDARSGGGSGGLRGHALGNLVLAALMAVTGDIQTALDEAGRLLGAVGRVVPATYQSVVLAAEAASGMVEGQSQVARTPRIRRVSVVPADAPAASGATAAISAADQVLLGPGSLYTSVLAATAVAGVAEAIRQTAAQRVYIANLRPQVAETEGYDVAAHVDALEAHGVPVDVVLCDPTGIDVGAVSVPVVRCSLAKANGLAHDPDQLAKALADLVGYEPRARRRP